MRDVSFNVERREFVAVLGPSGCGKSTLMMMCAGLDKPSRGEIAIDGAVLREPRTETGIMFQDPTLLPWLSVLDNVLIPITIARGRAPPFATARTNCCRWSDWTASKRRNRTSCPAACGSASPFAAR